MRSVPIDPLLRFIRQLATGRKDSELPDHQLLERFTTFRDESAFAALMRRHGSMVLSVCQSVLHNGHDAEDVFQAAFLVLAQKAGSIQRREAVSSWLYRVAYHLAVKAQARAARRKNNEKRVAVMSSADPLLDLNLRELRGVLYEELDRLPENYRSPLVLCYLEEKSQQEAALLLGWSKGSVIGRLQRGGVIAETAAPARSDAFLIAYGLGSWAEFRLGRGPCRPDCFNATGRIGDGSGQGNSSRVGFGQCGSSGGRSKHNDVRQ